MKIAVLSGKGGTGKTFISTNLANVIGQCKYIDCDVEEPNGELFLKGNILSEKNVNVLIPKVNLEECNGCRKCIDFCKFNAIAFLNNKPAIIKNICHSCGGCKLVCDKNVIVEDEYSIGKIYHSKFKDIDVFSGKLNVGETSGIPIIKEMMDVSKIIDEIEIIDCPPGAACSTMESLSYADKCIIVVEPTIFGFENFKVVYELVKLMNKPVSVIINRYMDNNCDIENFCKENNINIISYINYDKKIASAISNGELVSDISENYRKIFEDIIYKIGGIPI